MIQGHSYIHKGLLDTALYCVKLDVVLDKAIIYGFLWHRQYKLRYDNEVWVIDYDELLDWTHYQE